MAISFGELFWGTLAVAVLAALVYGAFRIEPHWVSRDGRRFICKGQLIGHRGQTAGGWREYRFRIDDDEVVSRRRSAFGRAGLQVWRVEARSDGAFRGKAVYLLRSPHQDAPEYDLAIRLPARSRAVTVLDELARA